jgi:hypothetical protein
MYFSTVSRGASRRYRHPVRNNPLSSLEKEARLTGMASLEILADQCFEVSLFSSWVEGRPKWGLVGMVDLR